ncbi:hypothetical protein KA183_17845 [bacterium]|nr:hypothetical protein [bacterium]
MSRIFRFSIIAAVSCLSLFGISPAFPEELSFEEQSELNSYAAQRAYRYTQVSLNKKNRKIYACNFSKPKPIPSRQNWETLSPQKYLLYRKDDAKKEPKALLQVKEDGSASINEPCLRFGSKPLNIELCTKYFGDPRISDSLYVFDLATDEFGEPNIFHLDMIFNSKNILEKYRVRGMGITNTELLSINEKGEGQ